MNHQHEQIAKYAYENSVFYREYMSSQLSQDNFVFEKLPIVSKEDMVASRLPLCSPKQLILSDEEDIITMSTSGSTGKMFSIEWDRRDFVCSLTELWILRKKYYEIRPNDKMCYFYTINRVGREEALEYRSGHTLGFSKILLNEKRIREIYQKMEEYQPVWMLLQPSMACMLVDSAKKADLVPIQSVRYIELSGEMLSEGQKKKIEKFFNCRVANQYGSYEFNSIAYECPYGNMHVMGSNVYVETLEEDSEENLNEEVTKKEGKEFIITSLKNTRNPFIRYRIGDRGLLNYKISCPCKNHNPVINLTVGRSHNYIECEDGSRINAYIFLRAVDNINLLLDDVVKQFQVVQRAVNDFLVKMYLDDRSQMPEVQEIFEENILEEALKNAKFEYCIEEGYMEAGREEKLMYFRREMGMDY